MEVPLPDHHSYDVASLAALLELVGDRPIVTTGKDAVKLAGALDPDRLWVLEQLVEMEAGSELVEAALDGILS